MIRQLRGIAHQCWQMLPQGLRRAMLFRVSTLLAPRASLTPPVVPADAPVIVVGPLTAATGLGEWTRMSLKAFEAAGRDTRGVDLSAALMQGGGIADMTWRDGHEVTGPATVLLHINAPYVPLALLLLGRKFLRGKRIIAAWAWELPDIPADWHWGLPFVHEIWALSRFTAEAIARHTARPITVTPLPVTLAQAAPPESRRWRKAPGQFVVLTMFNMASGFTRKNPLGAITAFQTAFGDDPQCRLVMKIVNPDAYAEGMTLIRDAAAGATNIEILTGTYTAAETAALIEECDVVLSLHRAEGFGLVPAEAMRRGKVAVATGWSGNMDFMTAENSCPVRYSMVPAHDPQTTYDHGTQDWADPDAAHAADYLRRLRADPAWVAALGARAARDTESLWSLAAYARHLT